jgi:hypothetical protein
VTNELEGSSHGLIEAESCVKGQKTHEQTFRIGGIPTDTHKVNINLAESVVISDVCSLVCSDPKKG